MFPGLHLLLDTGITLREDGHSLSLWGSPWTLVCDCPGWAFQASDEAAIKENYMCRGSIPQVDIFLAHSPIYGVLDRAQGIRHIGSKSLGRIIADTEPQLLVHGHVHEDFGMAQFGNTIVGNVSYLGDNMVPRKEMVELHYEKENAQLSVVGLHSVS
jgi:Icc-related predicted phosphoesterase